MHGYALYILTFGIVLSAIAYILLMRAWAVADSDPASTSKMYLNACKILLVVASIYCTYSIYCLVLCYSANKCCLTIMGCIIVLRGLTLGQNGMAYQQTMNWDLTTVAYNSTQNSLIMTNVLFIMFMMCCMCCKHHSRSSSMMSSSL